MGLVLYDLETTGLSQHFDQIVQFGALRVGDSFETVEHYEAKCRLQPHIVPAPSALRVTGLTYEELISASRPSHFQMIVDIHARFRRWSPTAFLGYNSIRFDEEFLRHSFYQCLLDPYVTSIGNARGDVLRLARAVSQLRPDVLPPAYDGDGRRSMRLHDVASACGFRSAGAHEAMSDVEAMLWIVRIIGEGAPDLWSRFQQFSTKAAALDFMREEDAFVSFTSDRNGRGFQLLTAFGQHPQQAAIRYCLDLTAQIDDVRRASHDELVAMFTSRDGPLKRVKANASPLLFPTYEVIENCFCGLDEDEVVRIARSVRTDEGLVERLNAAAYAAERTYPPSEHVEQQLYERFIDDEHKALMQLFHAAPWEARPRVVSRFTDERLRRLGQRAIYFEAPQLLSPGVRSLLDAAVQARWTGDPSMPWMTAAKALDELEGLVGLAEEDGLSRYGEALRLRGLGSV